MKGMLSFFLFASSGVPFSVKAVCKLGCCPGVKGIVPESLLNLMQRRATAEHGGAGFYLGALLLGTIEENEEHKDNF